MDNRLTQEQIAAVRKILREKGRLPPSDEYLQVLAPHVQYPIAEPTGPEALSVWRNWPCSPIPSQDDILMALQNFVERRRNSPPDPLKSALEECKRRLDAKDYEVIIAAVKDGGK